MWRFVRPVSDKSFLIVHPLQQLSFGNLVEAAVGITRVSRCRMIQHGLKQISETHLSLLQTKYPVIILHEDRFDCVQRNPGECNSRRRYDYVVCITKYVIGLFIYNARINTSRYGNVVVNDNLP